MGNITREECQRRDDAEWNEDNGVCKVESTGWMGSTKKKIGAVRDKIS